MSDQDREFASYGLVMPFVVVTSKGGPFEDDAFVAGFRCGDIDRTLSMNERANATFRFTARTAELPQLDLIAMHRGYAMERGDPEYEGDGWVVVTFVKASDDGNSTDTLDT